MTQRKWHIKMSNNSIVKIWFSSFKNILEDTNKPKIVICQENLIRFTCHVVDKRLFLIEIGWTLNNNQFNTFHQLKLQVLNCLHELTANNFMSCCMSSVFSLPILEGWIMTICIYSLYIDTQTTRTLSRIITSIRKRLVILNCITRKLLETQYKISYYVSIIPLGTLYMYEWLCLDT